MQTFQKETNIFNQEHVRFVIPESVKLKQVKMQKDR